MPQGPTVRTNRQLLNASDEPTASSMSLIETYRANAAKERAAAASTNLANRKAMHERSAMTWEAMAASAQDTAEMAAVNHAAKYGG